MEGHLADIAAEGLREFLAGEDVTDVSVQTPGEVWVRTDDWQRHAASRLTRGMLDAAIDAIANRSRQSSSERQPLLSAELPSGERVQIVRPPVCDHPVIVVRNPSRTRHTLASLSDQGVFAKAGLGGGGGLTGEMRAAYEERRWRDYLSQCVLSRRNVLVTGPTGSGKTTLLMALAREIPVDERLVTIEDVRELDTPHSNAIRMRYSKGGQGTAGADPRDLLEACLRMRPDRILFGELRGGEAFQFLRNLGSGHPGSLTSIHAGSPSGAIDQLALLARQSGEGRGYGVKEMRRLAASLIDVVVSMEERKATAIADRQIEGF